MLSAGFITVFLGPLPFFSLHGEFPASFCSSLLPWCLPASDHVLEWCTCVREAAWVWIGDGILFYFSPGTPFVLPIFPPSPLFVIGTEARTHKGNNGKRALYSVFSHCGSENSFSGCCLQLSTVSNYALLQRSIVTVDFGVLQLANDVHTVHDLAEDDMHAVEVGGGHGADEELRAVGVLASVGHGEDTGASVFQSKVLIVELSTIDGLAASAIEVGEITALDHEILDDAMEDSALEMQRLAGIATFALLASAQATEVLGSLGGLVREQLHGDTASLLGSDGDVEENTGICSCHC